MFEILKKQDVLLHHPFDSFQPVINLLKEAAKDPNVLAIKQTLYRSGPDSENCSGTWQKLHVMAKKSLP